LIAGNWKMHTTIAEAVELAEALLRGLGDMHDREVLICPPYTALHALSPLLQETPIGLGAQDVFFEEQGAYTGAISPLMLKDVGCIYTIVGHSERRQIFGDTDAIVNRKLHAALSHGLRGILCVGETKPERDSGAATAVVIGQLRAGLSGVAQASLDALVIAYEPVWAIGTGWTPTPQDVAAVHEFIRHRLCNVLGEEGNGIRILYGGSVKPSNARELLTVANVDGALVGGASLKATDFYGILSVYSGT